MLSFIKPFDLVHVRSAEQLAVEAIGPGVIRTLDRLAQLAGLFLAEPCPAVAADIVKSTQLSLLITQNDQTFTGNLLDHTGAGFRQLTLVPHTQSLSGKNALLFLRKDLGRNEVTLRQSLGAGGKSVGSFAKCGHYVCLHIL